jgi:TetR/AcrR family tetracycline transcriptional repressor
VTPSLNRAAPLDQELVICSALRLLDDTGLEGLTLRRLAAELDVQAPALYWHFASKQDLLDHMADALTRPWMQDIRAASAGRRWEDWLAGAARAYRALLLSRRDGARLVASTRPLPDSLPLLDSCIAAFQDSAGCGPGPAFQCLTTTIAFTRGFALDEEAERHRARGQPGPHARPGTSHALEHAPQPVPHLATSIADIGSPSGDSTFEYGLRLIITGIRATLGHHRA